MREGALLSHAVPVLLTLDVDSLEAFEEDFARCVGPEHVFVPGVEAPVVGTRVRLELRLRSGAPCLALSGLVLWAYPPGLVPPGREAGMGLLVEEADEDARALLARLSAREGAGASAWPPGARLPPVEIAPAPAAAEPDPFAPRGTDVDLPELSSADFFLAEMEDEVLARRAQPAEVPRPVEGVSGRADDGDDDAGLMPSPDLDEDRTTPDLKQVAREGAATASFEEDSLPFPRPEPRPLPGATPFPLDDGSLPELSGVAFLVVPGSGGEDQIGHVEPFRWPERGSRRTSWLDEARDSGDDAFGDALARDPRLRKDPGASATSAAADGDESAFASRDHDAVFDEHTDPAARVSEAVQRALRSSEDAAGLTTAKANDDGDTTDVDHRRPPGADEPTASDDDTLPALAPARAPPAPVTSAGASVPSALWLGAADGAVEPLFDVGRPLPAVERRRLASEGAVELAVFEDAPDGSSDPRRLLGIARWHPQAAHEGGLEVELRLREDGVLEARAEIDGAPVRERFRTSWAARRDRPSQSRGIPVTAEPTGVFGAIRRLFSKR